MIREYQKFQIPDASKTGKDIVGEVNWSPNDQKMNESKMIRLTMPNGESCVIKRENLNEILFAIGSAEDQKKMIPQKIETVHEYETVLGVKATKDIRKGEYINFPIKVSVPCTAEEIIATVKERH